MLANKEVSIRRHRWAVVLLSMLAFAPRVEGRERSPCLDAETQLEMNLCVKDELANAKQELKEVLRSLRGLLTSEEREKLDAAQSAWTAYREAHCEFVVCGTEGGSLEGFVRASCRSAMTYARADELRQTLEIRREQQ